MSRFFKMIVPTIMMTLATCHELPQYETQPAIIKPPHTSKNSKQDSILLDSLEYAVPVLSHLDTMQQDISSEFELFQLEQGMAKTTTMLMKSLLVTSSLGAASVPTIRLQIKDNRRALNPALHIFAELGSVYFTLPVSKAKLQSLHSDSISLIRNDPKLHIKEASPITDAMDQTGYAVTLKLQQKHSMAKPLEFSWELPGEVYKKSKLGDDFINNGFSTSAEKHPGVKSDWQLILSKK